MSKIKLLKQVVEDMKNLASSLGELCQAMESNDTAHKETEPVEQSVTLEDVRAVLADKSRLGFTKEIKQIISEFGVTKLSDVQLSDYPALLQKAEVLGND